jgi:hypothetical protein
MGLVSVLSSLCKLESGGESEGPRLVKEIIIRLFPSHLSRQSICKEKNKTGAPSFIGGIQGPPLWY